MYNTLVTELTNHIFTITINRPDKLNAINNAMMDELNMVMDEVYANTDIRAAMITGSGLKAFIAGADIRELTMPGLDGAALAKKGQDIFFRIENAPKPVVAAINGFALGGGCELAMACHFRLASVNARFGQPEVNLGLIPGYGGTQRLVQLIGKGRALEMLMTGNLIDANTALHYGLVNAVVSPEELLGKTRSVLESIISKAPFAIGKCIQLANAQAHPELNGYEMEAAAFGECFHTEDMIEGTTAFLEKRKPFFQGR